jgi:glyoxylase-like metal-dependent hydrolase (beta-lactamase superfamily II)
MEKIERYANDEIIRWVWISEQSPWTSAYIVDGLLIDSGPPSGTTNLKQFIASLPPEQAVKQVIITHWHEDHSGGARFLSEELDIPIYIHKMGIEKVQKGFSYPDYRVFAWGSPFEPVPAIRPLDMDSITTKTGKYTFELFHLPGHSDDLIALIEPERHWAFVSDTIVPKYQMIFGEPSEDIHEDMHQIHTSLKKLQQHTVEMDHLTIFTAGFGEFPGHDILKKNISDIENLHEKVHELKDRELNDHKIVEELFGEEHATGHRTNYALSRLNLVRSLLRWPIE